MARKRKPAADLKRAVDESLMELARRDDMSDEERDALEAWLETIPGALLTPEQHRRLLDVWNDENAPYQRQREAGRQLWNHGDPAVYPDRWVSDHLGDRPVFVPKPGAPKPPPSLRQRGHRFADKRKGTTTEDAIYDAVARALADDVKGIGRPAEAHRKASGYDLWREGQKDGDDLPSGRRIRQLFGSRKTKRDRDVWATVVRLGRKAGRIPK